MVRNQLVPARELAEVSVSPPGAAAGPLGVAIATAGIAAAAEAPKAVVAAQGVATEFQADRDEVLVVEKMAQVGSFEADTVIEMDSSAAADTAASKSMAVAGAYFASAQLFQMLAFAFEAPVALVVISQWTFGAGAAIYGVRQCENAGSACGVAVGTLSLTAALGSLVMRPWAKTVLYAAGLETEDPGLKMISTLPHLIHNATRKTSHPADDLLKPTRERKLKQEKENVLVWGQAPAWLGQAQKAVAGVESGVAKEAGAISNAVPEGVKQQVSGVANAVTNATKEVVHDAANAGGAVVGAISKAVPKPVKSAAEDAAKDTKKVAEETAEEAEQTAMRLKNGDPDIHTTTVSPQKPAKSPPVADTWGQFKPALAKLSESAVHWAWPVLNSVLLISGLFALTELFVATGRHLPLYHKGDANGPGILARVLRDAFSQWMMGIALLVAAWVLSIILAPALHSTAKRVEHLADSGSSMITTIQVSLCITCFLACCCRAREEYRQGNEIKVQESASREELRPIKDESDAESQKNDAKAGASETASASILCIAITACIEAALLAMERPVAAWAVGNSYKSYFAFRVIIGLLPWSMMAPSIWGYTPSSPYELMVPVAVFAFLTGGMLVMAKRKARGTTSAWR